MEINFNEIVNSIVGRHNINAYNDKELIEKAREDVLLGKINKHIKGVRTLHDEYILVINDKSKLSFSCREFLIKMFEN